MGARLSDRVEHSVFWLLQAGLVAAGRQLFAIAVITLVISGLESEHSVIRGTDDPSVQCLLFESPLLQFAYLLTAIGLALSNDRFIELTAARIRRASRLMNVAKPEEVSRKLGVQLAITAIIFALFTVRAPPDFLLAAGQYVGSACVTPIGWAGSMSIGVACFGASARAALK